jgi:hypothetical protein
MKTYEILEALRLLPTTPRVEGRDLEVGIDLDEDPTGSRSRRLVIPDAQVGILSYGSIYGCEGKLGRLVEVERRSFLVHPAVEVVAERLPGSRGGPVENR